MGKWRDYWLSVKPISYHNLSRYCFLWSHFKESDLKAILETEADLIARIQAARYTVQNDFLWLHRASVLTNILLSN